MLSGNGELPAYPVRVACSHLAEAGLDGEELLGALARAVGVSGPHACLWPSALASPAVASYLASRAHCTAGVLQLLWHPGMPELQERA